MQILPHESVMPTGQVYIDISTAISYGDSVQRELQNDFGRPQSQYLGMTPHVATRSAFFFQIARALASAYVKSSQILYDLLLYILIYI